MKNKNKMETQHKTQLQRRMKQDSKKWEVMIRSREEGNNAGIMITTHFNSEDVTFENVLHKIELDLMTNLHYGFKNPIEVFIKEAK